MILKLNTWCYRDVKVLTGVIYSASKSNCCIEDLYIINLTMKVYRGLCGWVIPQKCLTCSSACDGWIITAQILLPRSITNSKSCINELLISIKPTQHRYRGIRSLNLCIVWSERCKRMFVCCTVLCLTRAKVWLIVHPPTNCAIVCTLSIWNSHFQDVEYLKKSFFFTYYLMADFRTFFVCDHFYYHYTEYSCPTTGSFHHLDLNHFMPDEYPPKEWRETKTDRHS